MATIIRQPIGDLVEAQALQPNLPHGNVGALNALRHSVSAILLLAGVSLFSGFAKAAEQKEPPPLGFSGPEIFPVENQISNLRAADFDGDGFNDLLVVNNARSRITFLYNQTGSTNLAANLPEANKKEPNELPPGARFRIESIASEKRISCLVVSDLNGDGRPDLAYYGEPRELVVLFNEGTNKWSTPRRWPLDDGLLNPNALSAGDINGDGLPDLALLGERTLYLLLQNKAGDFAEPRKLPFSGTLRSVQIADLNADGRQDLLFVNWEDRNPFRVRFQEPGGELGPELYFPSTPIRSYWVDNLVDSNHTELVSISQNSGRAQLSEFVRRPAETIAPGILQGELEILPQEHTDKAKRGMLWADINGDSLPDLLVAEPESGQLSVAMQRTNGVFGAAHTFSTLAGITHMDVADWDGDGTNELFVLSADERQVGISRMDRSGGVPFPTLLPMEGRPLALAMGRLSAKLPPVLAVALETQNKRSVLFQSAQGKRVRVALDQGVSGSPADMLFHDIDQDGRTDVLIVTPYEKMQVLRQVGDSQFEAIAVDLPVGAVEQPGLSTADLDSDGKPELLLTQRNFVRAVVLARAGEGASASGTNRISSWALQVKEQINGSTRNSRIRGVTALPREKGDASRLCLLDAETKALTLSQRSTNGAWELVKNIQLPIADFDAVRSLKISQSGRAIGLLGLNAAGLLRLHGETWDLDELDSYETPIKEGRLTDMVSGDINGDGTHDLIFLETARNYVDVVAVTKDRKLSPLNRWQVFEERTFRPRRAEAGEPREALVSDLTGDGKPDLVLVVHDRIILYPQE